MAEQIEPRRFEFKSDSSYKFWSVAVVRNSVKLRYGRIGTTGRTQVKEFDSAEEATNYAEKELAKKKQTGYVEVVEQTIKRQTNDELWESLKSHEPFLQSILESPDDLDQYMVYADWLLERGDPRGQFILSQIAAKNTKSPLAEQVRNEKLANEIRFANWRDWFGELSSTLQRDLFLITFHHGLAGSFQLPHLNEQIGSMIKNSPHCRFLRSLYVTTAPPELNRDDDDGNLNEGTSRENDTGLEPIFGADFRNLRTLKLSFNEDQPRRLSGKKTFEIIHSMKRLNSLTINASIVRTDYDFLFSKEMPNLTELTIVDPIGDGPIETLCDSDWMEQLGSLKLVCDLTNDIAPKIAERLNPYVMEQVDVTENSINEEGLNTIEKTGVSVDPIY